MSTSAREPMRPIRDLLLGAILLGLYAALVRPRMTSWGATPDEVADSHRGPELIPDGLRGATMATTIKTAAVWPGLTERMA